MSSARVAAAGLGSDKENRREEGRQTDGCERMELGQSGQCLALFSHKGHNVFHFPFLSASHTLFM